MRDGKGSSPFQLLKLPFRTIDCRLGQMAAVAIVCRAAASFGSHLADGIEAAHDGKKDMEERSKG